MLSHIKHTFSKTLATLLTSTKSVIINPKSRKK